MIEKLGESSRRTITPLIRGLFYEYGAEGVAPILRDAAGMTWPNTLAAVSWIQNQTRVALKVGDLPPPGVAAPEGSDKADEGAA